MKIFTTSMFVLILMINISSVGQVLSDDKLYEKAYSEVQNRNWPSAYAYLFAYIQRNPIAFVADRAYEQQVRDAYYSSYKNIESERASLRDEIKRLNTKINNLEAKQGGLGSSSQGISVRPEIPPLRPPVKAPAQQMQIKVLQVQPINGQWRVTLTSSSGSTFTGTLLIVTNEDLVSGSFALSDNSNNKVTGMYDGSNLVLVRNTGVTTLQTYAIKKIDENHFSGSYKNEGRVPDEGKIELVR